MGRKILATLAGLATGFVVIMLLETVSHKLYPPPPGLDLKDPAALKALIASMPLTAFLLVLLAYALASLLGGLVATLVAGRRATGPALVVGGVLMAGGVANVVMIPHPAWFVAASLALYLPLAYAGARLVLQNEAGRVAA